MFDDFWCVCVVFVRLVSEKKHGFPSVNAPPCHPSIMIHLCVRDTPAQTAGVRGAARRHPGKVQGAKPRLVQYQYMDIHGIHVTSQKFSTHL